MTDPHAEAERWAGPHDQGCNTRLGEADTMDSACDCSRRERVAGIEAALREAEERADKRWRDSLGYSTPEETWRKVNRKRAEQEAEAREDENRLWLATLRGERNAHSDHRVKVVADALREARRQGREAIRQRAATIADCYTGRTTIGDVIRALPLDEPAPEAQKEGR